MATAPNLIKEKCSIIASNQPKIYEADSSTYIIVDSEGKEAVATTVDKKTIFTATANDIREGKVAASERGVVVGEKVIPSYSTSEGYTLIPSGSTVKIKKFTAENGYDFTKLQAIICTYAGSVSKSVSAEKVAIDEKVYEAKSTSVIAEITRDHTNKAIDFGITNNSGSLCLLRYFTYKEI